MAQEHLDRLTAIDASFLRQEGPSSHMHVGGVARFEGPPPPFDELLDSLRMRLHLVPRYRQRLQRAARRERRPLWVDDGVQPRGPCPPTALPPPGADRPAPELAGRIFSQQLDRARPLWEVWMVEGLADGGFALVLKSHHAMIDGIAGVDIAQVLFDLSPVPADIPHPDKAWQPAREPCSAEVLAAGTLGLLRAGVRTATHAAGMLRAPGAALAGAREASRASARSSGPASTPRPRRRSTSRSARTAATRS